MMTRYVLALILAAFALVTGAPDSSNAQDPKLQSGTQEAQPQEDQPMQDATHGGPRSVLFMVDGSGSMWARFDTPSEPRAKIDVVRDLIRPLVAPGANNARIGLASFGHRRRGDCSDVEVIAPLGTAREQVVAELDKLNPRGKGPLALAIREAAGAIGTERPAAVVIVNDGVDNCRQDACAAATEFASRAPGVPIHVVGIAVDPASVAGLQCISKATGGAFFDARDPLALATGISEVAVRALGDAPATAAAPEAAAQAPAPLPQAALRATLALAEGGKPMASAAYWRVLDKDSGTVVAEAHAPGIAENVKPGDYIVEAQMGGMKASTPAHIDAGQPTTLALALKAARLAIKSKGAKPPSSQSAPLVTVREGSGGTTPGATVVIGRLDDIDALLPPASYLVTITDQQISQEQSVSLAEGTETTMAIDMKSGRLSLSAVTLDNGTPLQDVSFSILEDDPDSPDGLREVRRSRAPQPSFSLPAGTYYVVARSGYAELRQRIALSAGDDVMRALVLPASQLKLSAQVSASPAPGNAGLVYRIEALGKDAREIARVSAPQFQGLLNAGHYRVSATLEQNAAGAQQEITLEAGKPLDITLKIDAGEATLRAPATASSGNDTFWELRDAQGRAIWHATSGEPKVLLAPGRYSVRLETRDTVLQATFEIAAGEKRTIELGGG